MINVITAQAKLYFLDGAGASSTIQRRCLSSNGPLAIFAALDTTVSRVAAISDCVVYKKEAVYDQIAFPVPAAPQANVSSRRQLVLVFSDATAAHSAVLAVPAPVNTIFTPTGINEINTADTRIQALVNACLGRISSPDGTIVTQLQGIVAGEGF